MSTSIIVFKDKSKMLKNYKKVDLNTVYKMEKVCLKVVVDCLYGHCVDAMVVDYT